MKRLSDYREFLETDSDCLHRLIEDWQPSESNLSEKQYEQELQAWLRRSLPDIPVVAQYGIAKGKADLVVQNEHVVELKLAFTDETLVEFDRCIGQLERYRQKWVEKDRGLVYLVVVGKSGAEFGDMLRNAIKQMNSGYMNDQFFLIEKV